MAFIPLQLPMPMIMRTILSFQNASFLCSHSTALPASSLISNKKMGWWNDCCFYYFLVDNFCIMICRWHFIKSHKFQLFDFSNVDGRIVFANVRFLLTNYLYNVFLEVAVVLGHITHKSATQSFSFEASDRLLSLVAHLTKVRASVRLAKGVGRRLMSLSLS